MEGWLPCLILSFLLLGVVSFQYRLPGFISSLFLFAATASIYNIFLLAGLSYTKSTLFGAVCLLLFSQINSLNWLKLIKQYLLTKSYTIKMAMDIARKKSNAYIYEFSLMLLIPGAFFVFLLPASLKEIGIVIILGALLIMAFWLAVSNLYFPRLFISFAHKRQLWLPAKSWAASKNFEISKNKEDAELLQNSSELPTKIQCPLCTRMAPLVFLLGSIGLILWLSKFELHYPKFFKGNQLLTINSSSKGTIQSQLKGLSGQYRELKSIPQQIAVKHANTSNPLYFLFPESVDLNSITSVLNNSVKSGDSHNNDANQLNWTLQNTDAFSVMPALKTLLKLIVWSTLPLSCYCGVRFGLANTLSLLISSLSLVGLNYLFLLSTTLTTSYLLPEIILASFVMLLTFWIKTVIDSKRTIYPKTEEQDKRGFFKKQSASASLNFRSEGLMYVLPLKFVAIFYLSTEHNETLYALFILFLIFTFMQTYFLTAHPLVLSNFRFISYKCAFGAAKFFMKQRQRSVGWLPEEENVLGINI